MLKVFESFSGVGAQKMALRNINIDYEVVATSEIDENAILAYNRVHNGDKILSLEEENKSTEEKINYLLKKNIGSKNLSVSKKEKIDKLYRAVKLSKNVGDISKLNKKNIPNHNFFTYSFPCQDISTLGTLKGLEENSGTRSSLLWECKKIIEMIKPKYLLMENVKNLVVGKNKENFSKWLKYLEDNGYSNYWKVLDSKDYGIPQRRPRVLMVSKLGKANVDFFKKKCIIEKDINDILDFDNNNFEKLVIKGKLKGNPTGKYFFLDDRDWKINGVMINDICSTQRAGRTGLKCAYKKGNDIYARKLTALECCRLMDYRDKDYYEMKKDISDGAIMKICGNSIVVRILETIFQNIQEDEKYD